MARTGELLEADRGLPHGHTRGSDGRRPRSSPSPAIGARIWRCALEGSAPAPVGTTAQARKSQQPGRTQAKQSPSMTIRSYSRQRGIGRCLAAIASARSPRTDCSAEESDPDTEAICPRTGTKCQIRAYKLWQVANSIILTSIRRSSVAHPRATWSVRRRGEGHQACPQPYRPQPCGAARLWEVPQSWHLYRRRNLASRSASGSRSKRSVSEFRSIRLSQLRREWRRATVLYLSNNLEPVALVKGNVFRIRTFEVGSDALLITSLKSVLHQQCAKPLSDPVRIDSDEGQIPMWLGGMMFGHSLA
ncbi:hypothetical protein ACVWXQ_000277 [Bradyrhizobium sp. S3.14.4]